MPNPINRLASLSYINASKLGARIRKNPVPAKDGYFIKHCKTMRGIDREGLAKVLGELQEIIGAFTPPLPSQEGEWGVNSRQNP